MMDKSRKAGSKRRKAGKTNVALSIGDLGHREAVSWQEPAEDEEIRQEGAVRIGAIIERGMLHHANGGRNRKKEFAVTLALEKLCYESAKNREEYTNLLSFKILLHRMGAEKAKRRSMPATSKMEQDGKACPILCSLSESELRGRVAHSLSEHTQLHKTDSSAATSDMEIKSEPQSVPSSSPTTTTSTYSSDVLVDHHIGLGMAAASRRHDYYDDYDNDFEEEQGEEDYEDEDGDTTFEDRSPGAAPQFHFSSHQTVSTASLPGIKLDKGTSKGKTVSPLRAKRSIKKELKVETESTFVSTPLGSAGVSFSPLPFSATTPGVSGSIPLSPFGLVGSFAPVNEEPDRNGSFAAQNKRALTDTTLGGLVPSSVRFSVGSSITPSSSPMGDGQVFSCSASSLSRSSATPRSLDADIRQPHSLSHPGSTHHHYQAQFAPDYFSGDSTGADIQHVMQLAPESAGGSPFADGSISHAHGGFKPARSKSDSRLPVFSGFIKQEVDAKGEKSSSSGAGSSSSRPGSRLMRAPDHQRPDRAHVGVRIDGHTATQYVNDDEDAHLGDKHRFRQRTPRRRSTTQSTPRVFF